MKQEYSRSRPIVRIGSVSPKFKNNAIRFQDTHTATKAWLMLASMQIPAFLDAGADGWYPNTKTTAWGKSGVMDYSIVPDIELLDKTEHGVMIYSQWMRCEFPVGHEKLFDTIAGLIREWRDIIESEYGEGELIAPMPHKRLEFGTAS